VLTQKLAEPARGFGANSLNEALIGTRLCALGGSQSYPSKVGQLHKLGALVTVVQLKTTTGLAAYWCGGGEVRN
jgi:hypothetical protein